MEEVKDNSFNTSENYEPIEIIKTFYHILVDGLSGSGPSEMDAKLKIGLVILYFWGYANNQEEIKNIIKREFDGILQHDPDFYTKIEQDFENIRISSPEIAQAFVSMDEEKYNEFVLYIQQDAEKSRQDYFPSSH